MNGIDISNWQSGIDVGATDADFVIVKATEGVGWQDPSMHTLADRTLDAGKLLGFYHFARRNSAEAEAESFVEAVEPYLGRCILALDYEADALNNGPDWARKWLDEVYERTGIKPIIYMSKSVCRSQNWSSVAKDYKLWAAQYPSYDTTGWQSNPWTDSYGFGAWSSPWIYQYSSCGRIQGYSGNLDINKLYGTREEWLEMEGDDMSAADVLTYNNPNMEFSFTNEEDLWQNVYNAGHILVYKREDMNGDKDVYQLITDAAKASERIDAVEEKLDKIIEALALNE